MQEKARDPRPSRACGKESEPFVRLFDGLLPTAHELGIERRRLGIELMDCGCRYSANQSVLHRNGGMSVRFAKHGFQPQRCSLPEKADNSLRSIWKALHQLHDTAANGEQRTTGFIRVINNLTVLSIPNCCR